jgi:hypothetical protein
MKLFPPITTATEYVAALADPVVAAKFERDFDALIDCHALVLVLPAGSDAHAEFGFAIGRNLRAFVLFPEQPEVPELMYLMPDVTVVASIADLIERLQQLPEILRIYVASSWSRTPNHPAVVDALRTAGFEVFDYRNPTFRRES